MLSIDDHEIRDAANTNRKCTVRQALTDADALCAEAPDGAEPLARFLLKRICAARETLERSLLNASDAARQRWLSSFENVLVAFAVTLREYNKTKPFVERLLRHQHVVCEFKKIHTDFVALLTDARGDRIGLEEWESSLDAAVAVFATAVEAKVDDATTRKMYEADSRLALEAATLLKLAQTSGDRLIWHANPQAQRLWAAMEPWHEVKVPDWFIPEGDIKKVSFIAEGGYGEVYRGKWKSGTNVIVKYLFGSDTKDHAVLREELIREADLWSKMTHPHILQLSGACHVADRPFFVSEDAKSGHLEDYLVRNKSQRMQQLYQVALAIEYLHDKPIVHGDLKLDNVLVFPEGHIRLADFSLSRFDSEIANDPTKVSNTQAQAGALPWRAPEALEGAVQIESDIYSFAMCIIQSMTGEEPYECIEDKEIVKALIRETKLPELPSDTPAELCDLVKKMTKRVPEERIKIRDVIPVLKRLANEEMRQNLQAAARRCVLCVGPVQEGFTLCQECMHGKLEAGATTVHSSNVPKLLRMATLSDGHDGQSAPKLLSDYLRLHPADWFHVVKAGAIPVLCDIVQKKNNEEFAAEALKTLALLIMASVMSPRGADVVAAVAHRKMDGAMNHERVLALFKTQLQSGSELMKGIAVKTLGFWPDRKAISQDAVVISQIRELASNAATTKELVGYANVALNALGADAAPAAS